MDLRRLVEDEEAQYGAHTLNEEGVQGYEADKVAAQRIRPAAHLLHHDASALGGYHCEAAIVEAVQKALVEHWQLLRHQRYVARCNAQVRFGDVAYIDFARVFFEVGDDLATFLDAQF